MCVSSTATRQALQSGQPRQLVYRVPLGCRVQRASRVADRPCNNGLRLLAGTRTGRAVRLAVLAFRDGEQSLASSSSSARSMASSEHVSVAVDYYRLLQVPRVSRPDAIRKSYENLVKQPPGAAFSADTLFARAVLLKAAAESLTDAELRSSYDAKIAAGHTALRVSQQDLPGALVVLQEIGEYQLVLDLGLRWLELNSAQPDAGDVVTTVALAYCDRAGERLTAQLAPPDQGTAGGSGTSEAQAQLAAVLPACEDLDAALSRLRRHGMAQQLQAQIVGAMRDLAPDYACELAALPLGSENAARRIKGVALMRSVLRAAATAANHSPDNDATLPDGEDEVDPRGIVGAARRMLQRSRDVLTCSEQVSLLPDAMRGNGLAPAADSLYDGALAHLVEGFRSGWPHSVHQAERLLARLEEQQARQAYIRQEQADLAAAATARRAYYGGAAAANGPTIYTSYGTGGSAPPPPPLFHSIPKGDGQHSVAASVAAHVHSAAVAEHQQQASGGMGASVSGDAGAHAGGVALERAVCAILLGDYAGALELLGLEGGVGSGFRRSGAAGGRAGGKAPDASLRAFVLGYSPAGPQDLRPGLLALATRWLEGVALASFRDTAGQPVPPLEATWFADPRVAMYLQVWRLCRVEQVLAAAHFVCNLMPNLLKLVAAVAVKVAATAALAASRALRLSAAVAASAAAATVSTSASPRSTAVATASTSRRRQQVGVKTHGSEAVFQLGTAAAGANFPQANATAASTTSGTTAAASSHGPFGHPFGKPLREVTTEDEAAAQPSTFSSSRTTEYRERDISEAPDLRRRFAASASVDSAAAGSRASSTAANADSLRRTAASGRGGAAASATATAPAASTANALDADDVDDIEGGGVGARQRVSEAELRAHLVGLEKAMWDSELPPPGPSKAKKMLMYAAATVAVLLAIFFSGLRRDTSGASALAPAAVTTAAVARFTR